MIITVSRQDGSYGDLIAHSAAAVLGLAVVDRDIIRQAALKAGISRELLQRLMYVGQRKVADDFIHGLSSGTPGAATTAAANPLLGVFSPPVSSDIISLDEAAKAVGLIIREIASRGDVLILGQGGQALLQGQPESTHVLIVAPFEDRVARIAHEKGQAPGAARRQLRGRDESRRDYLARFHNIRWLDPLVYDLVINTARMPAGDAVSLIVQAASRAGGSPSATPSVSS